MFCQKIAKENKSRNIIGGILVLLFLNQMIEPAVLGETDSSEYYIKVIINVLAISC